MLVGGLGVDGQAVASIDTDAAVHNEVAAVFQNQVNLAADGDAAVDGQRGVGSLNHIPAVAPCGVAAGHHDGAGTLGGHQLLLIVVPRQIVNIGLTFVS